MSVTSLALRFGRRLIVIVFAAIVSGNAIAAEPLAPRVIDKQITKVVAGLLPREHISKTPLNDEISGIAFDELFQRFDYSKLYFEQRDLNEFSKERNALDEQFAAGDISFVFKVWGRFVERLGERIKLVEELLKEQPDFTIAESIEREPAKYAADAQEIRERWRKRLKYDLLALKVEKVEGAAANSRLTKRYNAFANRIRQMEPDEFLEHFINSFTAGYGAGTYYTSPLSDEAARNNTGSDLQGIGAALSMNDGELRVSSIVAGGAAEKYGQLKAGDHIISVAQGENGEAVDVREMKLNDAVKLIRGAAGTVVRLGVISASSNQLVYHDITRAKIEMQEVSVRGVVLEESRKADGSPFKVGVIKIPSMYMDATGAREGKADYKSCTRDVAKILKDFQNKQVDVVLLDVRDIFSGQLTETINLAALFIDSGPIVQVKTSDGRVQNYDDLSKGMDWKGPLVLLTNKYSGGTSEVLIAAIQDYRRGLIIGDETTTGFGSISSSIDLSAVAFRGPNAPKMGTLSITTQQLYRPNGETTFQQGVVPDVILPSSTALSKISYSRSQRGLKLGNVPAARFEKVNQISPENLAVVKTASEQRRSVSSDFAGLVRKIQQLSQETNGTISLREEEFTAFNKQLQADKKLLQASEGDEIPDANQVVKRDFYFNEVLAIATDYGSLLTTPNATLPKHEPTREMTAEEKRAFELEQAAAKERMAAEQEKMAEAKRVAKEKAEGWRTWTSTAGTKIEAKFKGMIDKKVKLEKRDGTSVSVPANLLIEEDLQWIKSRR